MAKQKKNVVIYRLSSKTGDLLVFRQINKKTIILKNLQRSVKPSKKQIAHQQQFKQATIYAKMILTDPEICELYTEAAKERKGITAYNIAVADFFNAPNIESVDLSTYTGTTGDKIRVVATDDFAVKSVHVQISYADGSLIEEGEAVNTDKNLWIYTATTENKELTGNKIIVTAYDIPGNQDTKELSL
jgi:hypothetical protein